MGNYFGRPRLCMICYRELHRYSYHGERGLLCSRCARPVVDDEDRGFPKIINLADYRGRRKERERGNAE